ncbi:hypothetical protein [Tenacibaculum aiptasiae]|uniref:hypothetical protein n=1 Tax=Tenacibaculum aiptasiae TaxID=426481 RepID=UPI00232DDDAA|nr:hypothetical protein [Tenacibaculum aiptasiae]
MMKFISLKILATLIITFSSVSCSDNTNVATPSGEINPGNDPNFKIEANKDTGFSNFPKKVMVFGIPIYALAGVEDVKLLHAANIMAQYLDNNEDGVVDNQLVLDAMKQNKAFLFMWKNQNNNISFTSGHEGQDLGADETVPGWHTNGHTGRFDASLEEIWHIINLAGHAKAYPNVFGLKKGTQLANAMDKARGGYFQTIPNPYPAGAWYTYDDSTCDYASCQTVEYFYWSMTSILGAQANRLGEIQQEWKLNTKAKVQATDKDIYSLLTNATYKLPTVLPDGTYKR